VPSKEYFARQADTLLRLAELTNDHNLAIVLVEKAADMRRLMESAEPMIDLEPIDMEPIDMEPIDMEKPQDRPVPKVPN
jgi:hypothetical protein